MIDKLKPHLARYGLPDQITTDNGPQFDCREFQQFAEQYQFEHIRTSPRYPQSNGKAENSVKTAKQILKKAFDAGRDPQLSLLDFRNTPSEGMDSSPAQRLFSRRTRTSLPIASQLLQPQLVPDMGGKLQERKLKQAMYYNRGAKVLQPLQEGDVVRVRPLNRRSKWFKARVDQHVDVRSYNVRTEDGRLYRRNRSHLYKVPERYQPNHDEELVLTKLSTPEHPEGACQLPSASPVLRLPSVSPTPRMPHVSDVQPPTNGLPTDAQPREVTDPAPVTTRSGRIVRKPAYLKDFCV